MKDLLINGTRFLTTDDIADATLEYSALLAQFRRVDTVRFPAVVAGTTAQTAVAVGAGAQVAVVDAPDVISVRLAGAPEAAARIRRSHAEYDVDFAE
ncbi:hypothetical protein [Microbacterium sp. SLBN-146]|uniref:hypothetical protein n=1 Tax=Microbacterium sp. SLBN-146 TaxID=2768457 RepID=UPI0011524DE0|nr:hypothetical protein [Microbacterium sp. SLBN-146]TQJ29871.1 hypothetical protein FBY39_0314 [Microbacterium sp. SLBN-146]